MGLGVGNETKKERTAAPSTSPPQLSIRSPPTMHHFRCICIRQISHYFLAPPILGSVNGYAVAPPFTTATPFSLPCMTRSPHTMHHFQRN